MGGGKRNLGGVKVSGVRDVVGDILLGQRPEQLDLELAPEPLRVRLDSCSMATDRVLRRCAANAITCAFTARSVVVDACLLPP